MTGLISYRWGAIGRERLECVGEAEGGLGGRGHVREGPVVDGGRVGACIKRVFHRAAHASDGLLILRFLLREK